MTRTTLFALLHVFKHELLLWGFSCALDFQHFILQAEQLRVSTSSCACARLLRSVAPSIIQYHNETISDGGNIHDRLRSKKIMRCSMKNHEMITMWHGRGAQQSYAPDSHSLMVLCHPLGKGNCCSSRQKIFCYHLNISQFNRSISLSQDWAEPTEWVKLNFSSQASNLRTK